MGRAGLFLPEENFEIRKNIIFFLEDANTLKRYYMHYSKQTHKHWHPLMKKKTIFSDVIGKSVFKNLLLENEIRYPFFVTD